MSNLTPEQEELFKRLEIEYDNEGRTKSNERCPRCGQYAWVKSKTKPFRWESDVMVTTFFFTCKECGAEWKDYDSD